MALRREMKNIVKQFSDIEIKVREATSNDPWGAPTSLLSEIADATNNRRACAEAMQLLWKRVNETGKNWRHVYKSLIVLDYIIKAGNECVASQCKDNMFTIKVLEEFKFIDKDGKDQGLFIRDRSKQIVELLKDDERLKDERQRALKAKRMIHKTGGVSNTQYTAVNTTSKSKKFLTGLKRKETKENVENVENVDGSSPTHSSSESDQNDDSAEIDSEIENVRPSNEVEEEMQLQIALATSREESEQEERKMEEGISVSHTNVVPAVEAINLLDIADTTNLNALNTLNNSFSANLASPESQTSMEDPWSPTSTTSPTSSTSQEPDNLLLDIIHESPVNTFRSSSNINLFDISPPYHYSNGFQPRNQNSSNVSNFLDIGAHLVDLDNIISDAEPPVQSSNPFKPPADISKNPFFQEKPKPKSINEMRFDGGTFFNAAGFNGDVKVSGMTSSGSHNPFSSWKMQVEVK